LRNLDVDVRVILKLFLKSEEAAFTTLRKKTRHKALVNTVMTQEFPYNAGNFLQAEQLSGSQWRSVVS
jgi:hypothetical protein